MTSPLTCSSCDAPLVGDQRYCIACGHPVGDGGAPVLELLREAKTRAAALVAPARRGGIRLGTLKPPPPRTAAVMLAGVMVLGVLLGAAVGPAMTGSSLASAGKRALIVLGPAAPLAQKALDSATDDSGGAAELGAPEGNVAAETGGGGRGSGDGGGSQSVEAAGGGGFADPAAEPSDPLSDPPPDEGDTGSGDELPSVEGTVVHVSHDGHGYVVASKTGELVPLHAKGPPAAGTAVTAHIRQLANGTFAEEDEESNGEKAAAKLAGDVTFVDADARVYVVSVRGASIVVHAPEFPAGAQPGPLPPLGAPVTAEVAITPDKGAPGGAELRETKLEARELEDRPLELAAIVAKVDSERHTITVSADDVGATEKDIELLCDESVDLSALEKDELVAASVKIAPDGTYHVTGFSEDTDADAADDKSAARGDQAEQP